MKYSSVIYLFLLEQFCVCQALLDSKYMSDFYNICKGIAVDARDMKGSTVIPENVTFYTYTKQKPESYTSIIGFSTEWSHLTDAKANYVFIVHGWLENKEVQWYDDLKNAFFERDNNFVVIEVDWRGASNEVYGISSINTKDVGQILGDAIVKLHEDNHIPLEQFHIVGHSLGGQVAGFGGKRIYERTGRYLPRITALDPAGPLFVTRNESEKLSKHDAEVVFVIHTNGGTFGYEEPVGTIDLFPNGGSIQPGCARIDLTDITSLGDPVPCDHQRSWGYYIEAIRHPERFVATRCIQQKKMIFLDDMECFEDDTVTMGDLTTTKSGNYYLKTNSDKPYGTTSTKSGLSRLMKVVF